MHDSNLQRLAGRNLNVKDLTQEELTKITVRAGAMEAKIPSLEEWIRLSIQLNLPQLPEIKLHGGETPDLVLRLLAVLDRAGVVRQAWAAGYNVIVWTLDDEQQMRNYMDAAVDGIITDRPDIGIPARADIAEDKGMTGRLSDAIARSASF